MNRLTAAIAAGSLAIGILIGSAGTIVVGNALDNDHEQRHAQMGSMMKMMSDPGMGSMMKMMSEQMDNAPRVVNPDNDRHEVHHPGDNQ